MNKTDNADRVICAEYGDTWWSVASRELGDGTLYDCLKNYNRATSDTIVIGQTVHIPTQKEAEKIFKGENIWTSLK